MKFNIENCNTPEYWNLNQTALDYGLRQQKYLQLAGVGRNIVELGCGLSPMLEHACYFKEAWGVDYSPETIKKATELYPDVKYICADVRATGIESDFFDAVVSGEVIEHLEDPELLLKEMERICAWNGIMILSTPLLEFEDKEHLWEFDEEYFKERCFKTEVVESERFKGRKYIFVWKRKER